MEATFVIRAKFFMAGNQHQHVLLYSRVIFTGKNKSPKAYWELGQHARVSLVNGDSVC